MFCLSFNSKAQEQQLDWWGSSWVNEWCLCRPKIVSPLLSALFWSPPSPPQSRWRSFDHRPAPLTSVYHLLVGSYFFDWKQTPAVFSECGWLKLLKADCKSKVELSIVHIDVIKGLWSVLICRETTWPPIYIFFWVVRQFHQIYMYNMSITSFFFFLIWSWSSLIFRYLFLQVTNEAQKNLNLQRHIKCHVWDCEALRLLLKSHEAIPQASVRIPAI